MNVRSLDVPSLRAAWWTHRALRRIRTDLRANGLKYSAPPDPPQLPSRAARGVLAVLRRQPSTCLERSLVLQRWHAAHDNARDVVIAVKGKQVDFAAHAWLDGDPDGRTGAFSELMRLPPR
jgi:transglutaminase superfamily protein